MSDDISKRIKALRKKQDKVQQRLEKEEENKLNLEIAELMALAHQEVSCE